MLAFFSPSSRSHLLGSLVALAFFSLANSAQADGPFEGTWRPSAARIDVTIGSWGTDCGPRPQSSQEPAGAPIVVSQEGDHLSFASVPRRTTRACWSDRRELRAVSTSYQSGRWNVVCRTSQDDPRKEIGNYTLVANGTEQLRFQERSEYDWTLEGSHCTATLTRTQTFERVRDASAVVAPTSNVEACVGDTPANMSVRPSELRAEPNTRVCFQVRVTDTRGCLVRDARVQSELNGQSGSSNCFNTPATPGDFSARFSIGNLAQQAQVRVRDLSDLMAAPETTEAGSEARAASPRVESEAQAAVQSSSGNLTVTIALVLAGIGVALCLIAFALLRNRRKQELARDSFSKYARRESRTSLPPASVLTGAIPSEPRICPSCRRGFGLTAQTQCPHDGTTLVSYNEFVSNQKQGIRKCPECGTVYPKGTAFCGKDGATLLDQ